MLDLLQEYKKSRKELIEMLKKLGNTERDKIDKSLIKSMIRDTSKIIEWLETGKNPYYRAGIDIRYIYHTKSFNENYHTLQSIPDILDQVKEEPPKLTKEQKEIIIKLFLVLSERERDCFIMHAANGMSMQEIAEELGISKSTVQTHIERARQKAENVKKELKK